MIVNPNTPGAGSEKYLPLSGGTLTGTLKVRGNAGSNPELIIGRDDMTRSVGFKQSAEDGLMLARTDTAGRISGTARLMVGTPVDDDDAVTKGYLDNLVGSIAAQLDLINGEVV